MDVITSELIVATETEIRSGGRHCLSYLTPETGRHRGLPLH
jgi:hypothetical protein